MNDKEPDSNPSSNQCPECSENLVIMGSNFMCGACTYVRCITCGLEGNMGADLHVCIPVVVDMLKNDAGFQSMVRRTVHDVVSEIVKSSRP